MIVTPRYKQTNILEQNTISIPDQDFLEVEHIAPGGGSADNAVFILGLFSHFGRGFEKDPGHCDVLDKGFRIEASGSWISALTLTAAMQVFIEKPTKGLRKRIVPPSLLHQWLSS